MDISVGILAGGKSSRIGINKAFLPIGNSTYLETIIDQFKNFDDVIVSVDNLDKYKNINVQLIEDINKNIGPIEGLMRVLSVAKNDYVFICSTDMPLISKNIVNFFKKVINSEADCYILKHNGVKHPLCSVYSKNILLELNKAILNKDYKLMIPFSKTKIKYINFEDSGLNEEILTNVNYPHEII